MGLKSFLCLKTFIKIPIYEYCSIYKSMKTLYMLMCNLPVRLP